MRRKSLKFIIVGLGLLAILLGIYPVYHYGILSAIWSADVFQFIYHPEEHPDWVIADKNRCGDAPFILPSRGYIGFVWDISFKPFHRHQGVDLFGGTDPGITPVYAAYDGYLTRETDWVSTTILRIPQDPLQPSRQIWLYYTHMALPDGQSTIIDRFPPGSSEIPVKQGDLIGYQGNYSGTPGSPTGVHIHFSIVKDDGLGNYLNELKIKNTIDPSAYFGMNLNANRFPSFPISCNAD